MATVELHVSDRHFQYSFCVFTRGSWEISRQDLHNSEVITMVPSDRGLTDSDYDEYSASSARSAIYCRLVTITVSFFQFITTSLKGSYLGFLVLFWSNEARFHLHAVHGSFGSSPDSSSHNKWFRAVLIHTFLGEALMEQNKLILLTNS